MIDVEKLRASLINGLMRNTNIDGSTHSPDCEYYHLPCAILALCDELDQAHAEIKRLKTQLQNYDQYTRNIGG